MGAEDKKENAMRQLKIEKLILNVSVGESGDRLTRAAKVLEQLAASSTGAIRTIKAETSGFPAGTYKFGATVEFKGQKNGKVIAIKVPEALADKTKLSPVVSIVVRGGKVVPSRPVQLMTGIKFVDGEGKTVKKGVAIESVVWMINGNPTAKIDGHASGFKGETTRALTILPKLLEAWAGKKVKVSVSL